LNILEEKAMTAVINRRDLIAGSSAIAAGSILSSVPGIVWSDAALRVTTLDKKDWQMIGTGVRGPEGPTVLPDDSIAMVEFTAGNIVSVHRDGKVEVLAALGTGVAGTVLGKDGALYVAKLNTDAFMRAPRAGGSAPPAGGAGRDGGGPPPTDLPPGTPSAIVRIDLKARQSRILYSQLDGKEIPGPNDLCIDQWGDIWFSDPASSSVCNCRTDGSLIKRVIDDVAGVNGITLSPDKRTLYIKGGSQLLAFKISARGAVTQNAGKAARKVLTEWPTKFHEPDGMKTEVNGNILCACWEDGIVRFSPNGKLLSQTILPGLNVINLAFSPRESNSLYLAAHPATERVGGPVKIAWDTRGIA
jgi:gluconolactonase